MSIDNYTAENKQSLAKDHKKTHILDGTWRGRGVGIPSEVV